MSDIIVLDPATEESLKVSIVVDREPTLNDVTVDIAVLAEGVNPATDGTDFGDTCTNVSVTANGNSTWTVVVATVTIGSSDAADISPAPGTYALWSEFAHAGWDDIVVERAATLKIR